MTMPSWVWPTTTGVATSGTGPLRLHYDSKTWEGTMCFVALLNNVNGKPRVRRHGDLWRVTYEPRMIAVNEMLAA